MKDNNSDTDLTGRNEKGQFVEGNKPIAGFDKHPEHRSPGGWKKEDAIGYQYNFLVRLPVDKFKKWLDENPEDKRTMAQELAYQAVLKARKELSYLKEVTDRTEGKAVQPIQHEAGESISDILDRLDTDYGELANKARSAFTGQVVETNPPIQDTGQTGESSNISAKPDAAPLPDR